MHSDGAADSAKDVAWLEVCVGSVEDALTAERAGAGRLELCSALELGGLTPSLGLTRAVLAASQLPVLAMVRPRAGGFCYSESERDSMRIDAETALGNGAAGIVFGGLNSDATVDQELCQLLIDVAAGHELVFHRAFDSVADPESALETLMNLGFTRVLTRGQGGSRKERVASLRRLADRARGRIEILAGGGVRAADVRSMLIDARCCGVHIGAAVRKVDPSVDAADAAGLCDHEALASGAYRAVDETLIELVRASINEAASD